MLHADDAEENLNDHDDGSIKENFREQDIYLPIANVARIMKNAVPQTGKVSAAAEASVGHVQSRRVKMSHFKKIPYHLVFIISVS